MKRGVGIVLIAIALVLGTAGLDGAFMLAMGVLAPRLGALMQPTINRVAWAIGVDPAAVIYAPGALALVAIALCAIGQRLSMRRRA